MAIAITNENYGQLMASGKPMVIDFWATWCGPCRKIAPDVEALAAEYEGRVVIGKCDVEEADDIAAEYKVRNIPTLVFLKDGQVVDKLVGANPRSVIEEKIKSLL